MDLDDDSIENGTFTPVTPGCKSETSIFIRQVRLRKITSAACTQLYSARLNHAFPQKEEIVQRLIRSLDEWYKTSPVFLHPTTPYEIMAYHELQYHRERMTLFRGLALATKSDTSEASEKYLRYCLEAAVKVVAAYQILADGDSLVMHWTCVNDILASGFMVLYSSLRIKRNPAASWSDEFGNETISPAQIIETIETCRNVLRHISKTWKIITYHLGLFEKLASEVTISNQGEGRDDESDPHSRQLDHRMEDMPLAIISSHIPQDLDMPQVPLTHFPPDPGNAIMWDASMDFQPGDEFEISDAELKDIFANGFQDLQWDWNMMSSALGTGL